MGKPREMCSLLALLLAVCSSGCAAFTVWIWFMCSEITLASSRATGYEQQTEASSPSEGLRAAFGNTFRSKALDMSSLLETTSYTSRRTGWSESRTSAVQPQLDRGNNNATQSIHSPVENVREESTEVSHATVGEDAIAATTRASFVRFKVRISKPTSKATHKEHIVGHIARSARVGIKRRVTRQILEDTRSTVKEQKGETTEDPDARNDVAAPVTSMAEYPDSGDKENKSYAFVTTSSPGFTIEKHSNMSTAVEDCCPELGETATNFTQGADSATIQIVLSGVMLAVDAVGITLNVPSFLTFRRMSPSTHCTFMSIVTALDTLYLLLNIPTSVMVIVMNVQGKRSFPLYYAKYLAYFNLQVQMGVLPKVLLIVTALMTLDRFLVLAFPLKNLKRGPLRHPKVFVLMVIIVMLGVSYFQSLKHVQVIEEANTGGPRAVVVVSTETGLERFTIGHILFISLSVGLPSAVIVVSNLGLFISLAHHSWQMRHVHSTHNPVATQRSSARGSALVVLGYSGVFVCLNLPMTVDNMMSMTEGGGALDKIRVVIIFLLCLASSAEFFLYYAISSNFRATFKRVMHSS